MLHEHELNTTKLQQSPGALNNAGVGGPTDGGGAAAATRSYRYYFHLTRFYYGLSGCVYWHPTDGN